MKKFFLLLGLLLLPINSIFASDAETEKIQWHLYRVEGILRKVDTSSLTEEQKVNRKKMLDRLHSYTETGKFPNNDKFPGESVPFFRGSNGNLCAVGYLMDADPEYKPFIETIVQTNNNVKIMDVQDNPTLNMWAKKYGFSILELAMIQPHYDESMQPRAIVLTRQSEADLFGIAIRHFGIVLLFIALPTFLLSYVFMRLNNKKLGLNKTLIFPRLVNGIFLVGKILLIISLVSILFAYILIWIAGSDFIHSFFNF